LKKGFQHKFTRETRAGGNNMKIRALLVIAALFVASAPLWGATEAASGFATLKNLAGQWETKGPDGNPMVVTWMAVSAGSAMMEEMPHESMVTMYHLDNNRLLMTHYCAAGNQPRMQAEVSPDGKTIVFNFLDATNLASPADGHMHKMVLTIRDNDHFSEQWFFSKDGKDVNTKTFQYARKQ
jgi:hypothetical protein